MEETFLGFGNAITTPVYLNELWEFALRDEILDKLGATYHAG
jgi:hypothetical protein